MLDRVTITVTPATDEAIELAAMVHRETEKLVAELSPVTSSVTLVPPGSFISHSEHSRGDYQTAIDDKVPSMRSFEALVCVGDPKTRVSMVCQSTADVSYALFARKIPVLVLGAAYDAQESPGWWGSHPLLESAIIEEKMESCAESSLRRFLTFPPDFGRVFVIEGGDGAGKQTQAALLCERLSSEGFPVATLDYPHDRAEFGVLIREILSGKMGSIRDVDPLMFAALYGANRVSTLPQLKYWLQRGRNVVLDRYVSANFGHQASKLTTDGERNAIIQKLRRFEFDWLGLPEPDRVLYLNLPPTFALLAMKSDSTRRELDMHEKAGVEYKDNVRRAFLWCCKTFCPEWEEVPCVSPDGALRLSREEVHEDIYRRLQPRLVNRGL